MTTNVVVCKGGIYMMRISDAELEVMKIIWEKGEVTSLEIINELKDFKWNDNTVRTLINRLIAKKAVKVADKSTKAYTYVALIEEDDYRNNRSTNFIRQFFHGSLNEMMLNFVDRNELTQDELIYLKDKIDKKIK